MTASLLAGAIAGFGVAIPVGAIAVLVAGLAARSGIRAGAAAGLGAATADGVYAAAAVLGGAALSAAIAPLATTLRWVAAAVLLALAAWTARSAVVPPLPAPEPPAAGRSRGALLGNRTTARSAYLGVLGLTLLNPATVVYFTALVLGRGGEGGGFWFVAGAFLASAGWQLLLAATGALAGRFLTSPRAQRLTTLLSAAIIAALALAMLL